jgi:hypothetical protein
MSRWQGELVARRVSTSATQGLPQNNNAYQKQRRRSLAKVATAFVLFRGALNNVEQTFVAAGSHECLPHMLLVAGADRAR